MYRKILAAHDGSAGAQKAFTAALALAKGAGVELHMVTVEELPRFPASIDEVAEEKDEANHRLAPVIEAARQEAAAARTALVTHLVPGHVAEAVSALVQDLGIDLLVVGFMGHSRLYDRIIGSTTDRLVRLTPCAVLVVK